MHRPTMTALEFDRIRQELAAFASCQLGKELALAVEPLPTLEAISRVQQETSEAKELLTAGRTIPFGGIQDIRTQVERAASGGVLTPDQLTSVADTIYGCRQLHRFLAQLADTAPLLSQFAVHFGRFDQIEDEIRRCIERGNVASRASRALREIRNEIAAVQNRIQDRLNAVLRQFRNHLQDPLITTRNGRYVVPVKASSRNAVPGAVHGASASGASLFVEPEAIRHLCEELETWQAMERAEEQQILAALSDLVAAKANRLKATLGAAAQLDLIVARARLSRAWSAEPVIWNEAGLIDLKGARHPLLGQSAVGNRIRLSREQRMLIVTGPNTGGKTLLLKTLGLLVIIARCGLHISAEAGSTLCFFDEVFADIGDKQSLEQSLSTFSGHIANVVPMLVQAGPRTLVLLDELGSGTDPHEGTALGIALLEAFLSRGAYTLATTHLREIKEFGRVTQGCAIAGMGFDGQTLGPTYRLIYGALGESQGLAIAARAGLPVEVVARAQQLVHGHGGASAPWALTGQVMPAATLARGELTPDTTATDATTPETTTPNVAGPDGDPPEMAAPSQTAEAERSTACAAPGALVLEQLSPGRCRIWADDDERAAPLSEGLRHELTEGLVLGDRIHLRNGQITGLAPRTNLLACRDADTGAETAIVANIGRLLILLAARKPDFHAGVLARHLFWAEYHGVTPVICLTKSDLLPKGMAALALKPFRSAGYQAVAVNLLKAGGADQVADLLGEGLNAVIGVDGAGKTTLLKGLAAGLTDGQGAEAGPLRGPNRRWPPQPRPVRLASGAWLVDLPGLRELGVWKPDLTTGFREFGPYGGACARPGCLHRTTDRDCAVREAVEAGRVQSERYRQYHLLLSLLGLA